MSEESRGLLSRPAKEETEIMVSDSDSITYQTASPGTFDDYETSTDDTSPEFPSSPTTKAPPPSSSSLPPSLPPPQRHRRRALAHRALAPSSADATFGEEAETSTEVKGPENERLSPEMGLLFSRTGRGRVRSQSASKNAIYGLSSNSVDSVGVDGVSLATLDADGQPFEGNDAEFRLPIVGYEINEERARFTIYKVRVEHPTTCRHWFVFRRYTDFARLNRKLKSLFPTVRFSIPPKRWFGDNFDTAFLEDRLNGLQAFVNTLMMNEDVKKSPPVREFFCLDDPPGPEDGFEESRALCESLEETVIEMQRARNDKEKEGELLKGEVTYLKTQMKMLIKSLRMECTITSTVLNRLQKAQDLSTSRESVCSSDASGCRYSSLHNIIRDHSFNVTFVEIMEKSLGNLGLSNSGSSLGSVVESCNATEEAADNSSTSHKTAQIEANPLPRAVKIPVTVHATYVENISRSTGDGSTGSSERLPPVGGIVESHDQECEKRFAEQSVPEITVSSLSDKPPLIEERQLQPVHSSTPKKCVVENAIVQNGITNITLEA